MKHIFMLLIPMLLSADFNYESWSIDDYHNVALVYEWKCYKLLGSYSFMLEPDQIKIDDDKFLVGFALSF